MEKQHVDSHYAACIFRYQREFAVKLRNSAMFACVDDKHRVKIGEPTCPVTATERGRQVIVNSSTSFQVADHDFTRFSMIPSVTLLVNIPESVSGSWYDGSVCVTYKDGAFEPSSPICHAEELRELLSDKAVTCLCIQMGDQTTV
jgi:hypothetical protein